MSQRLDGRMDPARIAGPGAVASYVLTWDGGRAVWSSGGDSNHPGTGAYSVAIGDPSVADADYSTAVGSGAAASSGSDGGTAYGHNAHAYASNTTAVGNATSATAANAIALGGSADASGVRSIAIGANASTSANDRALIRANELEVERSNGTGATGLRLYNEASSPYVLGLHVGTSAPTNGCVFWYDTDDTC